MSEVLVAGIDSSTQSTKVLLVRAADGVIVDQASAPHPNGTEVDPQLWWEAMQQAGSGLLERASAIAVGGQQHGMVALDRAGAVVRPALLWNDLRSAPQIVDVVEHLGGPELCARTIGSVPAASFTVTKLRWMAQHEPDNAARTAAVVLPHDWLTWMLAGGAGSGAQLWTDHGDASGTGYYSPARRDWLPEIAQWALGRGPDDPRVTLPRIAAPSEVVGHTASGTVLGAGTGDNMAAAMGLGLSEGVVAVSIGTSGTAFCVTDKPSADPTGSVAGFCDATGDYLPLVATVNATRVLAVIGELLAVDHEEFGALALSAAPGAGGLTLLPYLDGERTPNRPNATGVFSGLTSSVTRADLARSAVEALLCSLADAVDALGFSASGGSPRRVLMIGGGARNPAIQQLAPAILGLDVELPPPGEYVALGAARQAAWALAGTPHPPAWPAAGTQVFKAEPTPQVRRQYGVLRDSTSTW